jgi:hypothetical protein
LHYQILRKRFLIIALTFVLSSTSSLLFSSFKAHASFDDSFKISGVGEGTLYCADGTEYKASISFDSRENGLNGERFGNMDIRYAHEGDNQAASIRGVFNEFGSNVDEDQYKLRTEHNSNICNNSSLLYLGDLSGDCGEDITINLNGGYYLSGTFQGFVTCNLLDNNQTPSSQTPENSDKYNH